MRKERNMRTRIKDILIRFFGGFAFATFLGYLINMLISASIGGGEFLPVMPMLSIHFKTELMAVFVQFLLIGIIGVTFAEGALIFNIARWSFPLQCIIHFIVTAVIYIPFICFCWFPLKTSGILFMIANILFTYSLSWMIQYHINRRDVEKINQKLEEVRNDSN